MVGKPFFKDSKKKINIGRGGVANRRISMKEIEIKNYVIKVQTPDGFKDIPYDVAKSVDSVLLATGEATTQRLSMSELLRNARISQKITASVDKGKVLLEEAEFIEVKKSFEAFRGFGPNEVELCRRISDAKDVQVEAKMST